MATTQAGQAATRGTKRLQFAKGSENSTESGVFYFADHCRSSESLCFWSGSDSCFFAVFNPYIHHGV